MLRQFIYRSRSGRVRVFRSDVLFAWGCLILGSLFCVFSVLTLYTPFLHSLLGDWTGRAGIRAYTKKLVYDNLAAAQNVLTAEQPQFDRIDLAVTALWVEKNAFDSLNQNILKYKFGKGVKKPSVNGHVEASTGALLPVSVSYRGRNTWHHQYWKPSLRVRYKRKQLSRGRRDHHLVAPEDGIGMRNWLSTTLARKWGTLSNREDFELLFINRRFIGLYTNIWSLDESLLIHEERLPGPIFRFDRGAQDSIAVTKDFFDPDDWELVGVDPVPGKAAIQRLTNTLNLACDNPQDDPLDELLDAQAFARYLALLSAGSSTHVDDHNIAFFLDTTSGRFLPILIDANGYGVTNFDTNLSPVATDMQLAQHWLQNPLHLALYIQTLNELLTTIGSESAVTALIEKNWKRIRPFLVSDPYFSDIGYPRRTSTRSLLPVSSADENVRRLVDDNRARTRWLLKTLTKTEVMITSEEGHFFEVLVRGFAGVKVSRRDGAPIFTNESSSLNLRLLPTLARSINTTDLLPFAFYRLPGAPSDYLFQNLLNDVQVRPEPAPRDIEIYRRLVGTVPKLEAAPLPPPKLVVGPGVVTWRETHEFTEGQQVEIRAGTQLKLGPGVSVIVRGRLRALGTQDKPITVRPLIASQPFGTFAVLGAASRGTRFTHFDMEGGSIASRYNLNFTGMFSVHDCPDLFIGDSRFGHNFIGDDSVHIVRSQVQMLNSIFENSRADAVDWDLVKGEVANCIFRNTGNDGLDLSMGTANISGSRFIGCKDKCISGGEGTRAILRDLRFQDSVIGIAAKDSSHISIARATFTRCRTSLALYQKKWRWGQGGVVYIDGCSFVDSIVTDITGDKKSSAFFAKSQPNIKSEGSVTILPLTREGWPKWAKQ